MCKRGLASPAIRWGWRPAAGTASLAPFVAATGNWEKSTPPVRQRGLSVTMASAIGIPAGIDSARRARAHRVAQAVIDTLQTMPSFVYGIPVVMLFRVGVFSAMPAVIGYALAPAVRYTDHGIRQVPQERVGAAAAPA